MEVFFDDFTVEHIKSPVVQMDDYYPFGLTFNSYQRENSLGNKIKFQGQEHIDDLDLGWVQFKWRNHMPDIGRFFNIDPLADKYVYNSPYAFSENQVIAHRELEGLEKVFFQTAIANDEKYKKVYNTQRQTSGGKSFSEKLSKQKEYNAFYFESNGWASGINQTISSMDDLQKLKKEYPSIFRGISDREVEVALEGKNLLLIGVDRDSKDKTDEGAYNLNHEEFHSESTLDGNSGSDKNEKDHEKYYGEYRSDSPNDNAIKNDPKYKDTIAKKQYDEIDKILSKDEKRKQ